MDLTPIFPIIVKWPNDEAEIFKDPTQVACNLEWFDSEDPLDPTEVVDNLGRPVELHVEKLEIRVCKLKSQAT